MASSGSLFREYLDYPYGKSNPQRLSRRAKASLSLVQRMKLETKLDVHNGCVNTICWNETGTLILSGSDDQHICITDPFTGKRIISIQSGHLANIFSAKFLPNTQDNQVVSCSGDGMIQYTIVDRPDQYGQHPFDCHFGTTYELVTVPQDSNTFLSCGEDGTVRWFDLRIKDTCIKDECKEDILINCRRAVTALAINPLLPYQLSVGCSDSTVRIFDRRMLGTRATGNYTGRSVLTGMTSRFTVPLLKGHSHRVTSLSYSTDGTEVLASYSSEQLYLFNLTEDGSQEFQTDVAKTPEELKEEGTGEIASSTSPRHLPIKRLRLRGDWSDTGPNARPERERSPNQGAQAADAGSAGDEDESEPPQAEAASAPSAPPPPVAGEPGESRSVTIMQRMSDMLTRWLEGASRQADQHRGTSHDNVSGADADPDAELPALAEPPGDESVAAHGEAHVLLGAEAPDVELYTSATTEDSNPGKQKTISYKDEADISEPAKSNENNAVENSKDCKVIANEVGNTEEALSQSTIATAQIKSVINSKSESQQGLSPETSGSEGCQPLGVTAAHRKEVEPLVSLRYSRDSTSAATITVDFPESGTAGGPNLPPEVCAYNTPERRVSPSKATPSASISPLEVTNRASKSSVKVIVNDAISPVEATSSSSSSPVEVKTSASKLPVEVTTSASVSSVTVSASPPTTPVEVKSNASRSTSEERSEPQSDKPLSVLEPCEDLQAATVDSENSDTVNVAPSPDLSSVDIVAGSASASGDSDCAQVEHEAVTAKADESIGCSPSASEKPDASHTLRYCPSDDESPIEDIAGSPIDPPDSSSETPAHPDGSGDMPRRLASARARSVSGGEVVPPVGGRQRRHGRSGPPTGDFQLHSASEDDSDEELIHTTSRHDRNDAERNRAAVRLQQMYRKRLEERDQEEQQLLNIHQPRLKQVYRGHRNARTMIKEAAFWGDEFVMSGSDCGHIFVWDRHTAELVMLLEGDKHVVNCLQPHPMDPVLASSGIDYDIKVWMPTEQTPSFDLEKAEEVVSRNRVMLEETRDTITVPASFMLRMLASLNHIRSGRRQGGGNSSDSSDDE